MSFLFGGARTQQSNNSIKTYQRQIQHHIRAMERETAKSVFTEKTLIAAIKKAANQADMNTAKMKAKELIRGRNFRKRLMATQQSLSTLAQNLSLVQSTQQCHSIIQSTTAILQSLNNKSDLQTTYKLLTEFQKQNSILDEKQEIADETLEQMFEIDDSEVDDTLSSVFQELGLDLSAAMRNSAIPAMLADANVPIEERFAKLQASQK